MTIIASLLFAIALSASIAVIVLTIRGAMPRIHEVIDAEFTPSLQYERRIILGEMRRLVPATVIAFPTRASLQDGNRLAA